MKVVYALDLSLDVHKDTRNMCRLIAQDKNL